MNANTFYVHLHAFRGFAILNIVAAHCWTILIIIASEGNNGHDFLPLYSASEALFHNATIFFAVISGLLYSLVLKKYTWKKFYLGKMKNVLAPFLVFSVVYAFLSGMLMVEPGSKPLTVNEVLNILPELIITGGSFAHMWYIPVLMILFLLTPIFNLIVTNKKLFPVLVLIVLAPLVVSRSWPDFIWQNFVFFFGPYVLGILMGSHYYQFQSFVEKYKRFLWSIAIISTAALSYLYMIEYAAILGVKLQESIGYIQKLSICFVVLNILYRKENKSPKILQTLGDYSFSIYFVHMFFAAAFGFTMIATRLTPPSTIGIFFSGFVLLLLTLLVSIGFTLFIKKITGKYSRSILGA